MAALAPGAAGAGGGGGSWTVLVPSAVAAEWSALELVGGRAGTQAAAAAGSGSRGGDGVPEVALEIAALLAAAGAAGSRVGEGWRGGAVGGLPGRGTGEGAPYFIPIVFVPNKPKKDIGIQAARVIYGVLLFGPLAFIRPVNDALISNDIDNIPILTSFGLYWGILSIGFHFTLDGDVPRLARPIIVTVAHAMLTLFSFFVIFYISLLLPQTKDTHVWLILEEALLAIGHFVVTFIWVMRAHLASCSRQHPQRCLVLQLPLRVVQRLRSRVRHLWTKVRQMWAGVMPRRNAK